MHITVTASASCGKLQVLECHKIDDVGNRIGYKFVNAKYLKEMGVIKRFPGYKQAEAFFLTDEGLKFYEKTEHTPLI
jgi:hypothetical protein